MNIIKDFIPKGMRHRPMTNPKSSLYKKTACHKWLTYHEPWSKADARALHAYLKSTRAASRPASWHLTIDEDNVFQGLPWDESGWHAGDNLGPGNTQSIGKEVCDHALRNDPNDWDLFWKAVDKAAKVDAYLIINKEGLLPYPDCLRLMPDIQKQHFHWSGKNCPYYLRGLPDGWSKYIELVGEYIPVIGESPQKKQYRVIVASNKDYLESKAELKKARQMFPTISPYIVLNVVNDEEYYRVVLEDLDRYDHARVLVESAKDKKFSPWIVDKWEDLEFDAPVKEIEIDEPIEPDAPEGDLDPDKDPDLDRDWVDENPEEFEDGKDPYEDAESLLRTIIDMLSKLFKFLGIKEGD